MKTLLRPMICCSLALGLAGPVLAQRLTPGLWEHSTTIKSQGGQMEAAMAQAQAQMANLPPDQRKMMQEMMAKQGVQMGGQPNSVRTCITPAQAERAEIPQQQGQCTRQAFSQSGNTYKYKMTCSGQAPTTVEGEYTVVSDKAYNGRSVVNTTVAGKAERMDMTVSGKWLAADCGSIKPRQ